MSATPPTQIGPSDSGIDTPGTQRTQLRTVLIAMALAVATFAVYARVLNHPFLLWDDNTHVYQNPHVRYGLSLEGVQWAFGFHGPGLWQPLAWISHQLDCELFGAAQSGARWHHLTGLLIHIGSTLLLFEALRRMTQNFWPSALVAALFGLHPIAVESVAWVSERREVLAAFFGMLTLLAYERYARTASAERYWLVVLCLGLGLMCKPTLVTLPCVLLLLDFWPLRRWQRQQTPLPVREGPGEGPTRYPQRPLSRLVLEKLPLLAMAALASGMTVLATAQDGALRSTASDPWSARLGNAVLAYGLYLRKLVWPSDLATPYPYSAFPDRRVVLAVSVLLLTVTALAIWQARRRPYLLVGWLWYLGVLVPVSGIVPVGAYAFTDHFAYLPVIGIYLAVAWGLRDTALAWPTARIPLAAGVGAALAGLMAVTLNQVGYWRDDITLFTHTLRVTRDNAVAQNCLGRALEEQGDFAQAQKHYEEAIRLRPHFAAGQYNVGNCYLRRHDLERATMHFEAALRLKPNYAEAHNNLGTMLEEQGKLDDALQRYRQAIESNPEFAEAHYNLGTALARVGELSEARAHLRVALRLQRDNVQTLENLRLVETMLNQPP